MIKRRSPHFWRLMAGVTFVEGLVIGGLLSIFFPWHAAVVPAGAMFGVSVILSAVASFVEGQRGGPKL